MPVTRRSSGGRAALQALAALVLGLALGVAAAASGSPAVLRAARWLEPVGTLWVNAIRMTVIPLVVSSLVVAVAGTGARTVGRLGTRAFIIFVLMLAALAVLVALVAPVVFARLSIDPVAAESIRAGAGAVQRPELPTFASWLVGLVPANPIRAAADGAMLPLIVFTLAFGLALGRIAPERRASVAGFFAAVADAMIVLVGWLLALAPLGVFALALPLAVRLGTGVVGAVGFYLAAHSALLIAATLLLYAVVALFGRVSPARFARAALPAQVVAVSTRSSMAALPAMLTSAEHTLRLPSAVTGFALPLAVSTFRLNQSVSWIAMALFAGKLYGVPIGPAEVATLAVMAVLMSFSVPGIPSGGLFIVAPFFASVGIPPESIGVLIALDLIPDVFKTLTNVTGHLTAVTLLARGEREPRLDSGGACRAT
jgi:proton glutamate symport protein